jgi:hypothetical protein
MGALVPALLLFTGFLDVVFSDQGGPRGDTDVFPGIGFAAGVHFIPDFLEADYGRRPLSLLVFGRVKVR